MQRAEQSVLGKVSRQIVAIDGNQWIGSVSGILETPGLKDFEGHIIETFGAHLVGVWLAPEYRGQSLAQRMIEHIMDWARSLGVQQVRLYVHSENLRAQQAYAKAGFIPSAKTTVSIIGPEIEMIRPLATE